MARPKWGKGAWASLSLALWGEGECGLALCRGGDAQGRGAQLGPDQPTWLGVWEVGRGESDHIYGRWSPATKLLNPWGALWFG